MPIDTNYAWRAPLELQIRYTGSKQLGRCYRAEFFEATSLRFLTQVQISALRNAGLLGSGQEFYQRSHSTHTKLVPAVDLTTGNERLDVPPGKFEFHVYTFESRIDSGD